MNHRKADLLATEIQHLDVKNCATADLVEAMQDTAFQARNLSRAAKSMHK